MREQVRPPKESAARSKGMLLKAAVVGISVLLSLVALEFGLRVAASFVGPRPIEPADPDTEQVILALGDSNVYGWKCSAQEAYPGRLQSVLESAAPGRYRIVNLGLPGMNSTETAYRLDSWLERFRPQMIIITVGVNNGWIQGVRPLREDWQSWLRGLRLHRLYRILRASLASRFLRAFPERPTLRRSEKDAGTVVEQRDATTDEVLLRHQGNPLRRKPYTNRSALAILRRDLGVIHEMTSRNRIRMILLTYAGFRLEGRPSQLADETTEANAEMRRFAQETGITIVDVRERFLRLLPPGVARSEYFLSEVESHPNPRGYEEITSEIIDRLDLAESGT